MRKALLLLLLASPIFARAVYSNWCQQGNQTILLAGLTSSTTTPVQRSYPGCTITVFQSDGSTLASIFSDNVGTPKANPFTLSGSQGQYSFWADQGPYVIRTVNTGLTTFTFNIFMPFDGTSGGFITSLNGLTASTQTFAAGTIGTDFTIVSSGGVHTFNLPSASASNRGLLLAADWSTFNAKQSALTFTAPLVNTAGTVALTLPITIARGGTGQITQTLGFNALSPLTTTGDTLYFNGTNNIRLGIGTNGFCLTSNGTAPLWAVCPATPPANPTASVQFNGAGVFGGDANFIWDNVNKNLGIGGTPGAYKLDLSKSGASGTARFYDQTATTGVTQVTVRAGAAQTFGSCTNYLFSAIRQDGSNVLGGIDCAGDYNGINFNNALKKVAVVPTSVATNTRGEFDLSSDSLTCWRSVTNLDAAGTFDTCIGRNGAGIAEINNGTLGTLRDLTLRTLNGVNYQTSTNCASSASPAVCGSAASGSAVIAAAATTVVVNTTAVTANSQIQITQDSSLGTRLSVTCNTQATSALGTPRVTARVAATSFTVGIDAGPTTNPMCFSYTILN